MIRVPIDIDSARETEEILADEEFMADLEESIKQMNSGDTIEWDALKDILRGFHRE